MTEFTGPRSGVKSGYAAGEDGWQEGMEKNLRMQDAFISGGWVKGTVTAPPGSPANGDAWLIGSSATGVFSGHDNKIAVWRTATTAPSDPARWDIYPPGKGWRVWDESVDHFKYWTGGAWSAEPQSSGSFYTDEQARDAIGAALVAGTGIGITVDDPGDHITVAIDTAAEAERIRDVIGAALVAGTGITIAVNDAGDTITISAGAATVTESFVIAASDETTALTIGTKVTFRMPYAFTLTKVKGSLTTAQTSGSLVQFDVKEEGTSIFSTKPTIDNTEKTTETAATAAVISDASIAADAEITISITQIGDGTAKGLKVVLIGHQ